MRTIGISEFKAKCLQILDEVDRRGDTIVVTKRGKPLAYVSRVKPARKKKQSIFGRMKGSGEILGDIISPPYPEEDWDANRGIL